MRRFLLASCIALLPGMALAQSAPAAPAPADDGTVLPPPDGGPGPGPGLFGGGWGKGHKGMDPGAPLVAFYAANTTHDGHLTLAQAKTANLQPVVDNFAAIDVKKRGYVTFYDIEAWRLDQMAQRLEQKADQLRAKD